MQGGDGLQREARRTMRDSSPRPHGHLALSFCIALLAAAATGCGATHWTLDNVPPGPEGVRIVSAGLNSSRGGGSRQSTGLSPTRWVNLDQSTLAYMGIGDISIERFRVDFRWDFCEAAARHPAIARALRRRISEWEHGYVMSRPHLVEAVYGDKWSGDLGFGPREARPVTFERAPVRQPVRSMVQMACSRCRRIEVFEDWTRRGLVARIAAAGWRRDAGGDATLCPACTSASRIASSLGRR